MIINTSGSIAINISGSLVIGDPQEPAPFDYVQNGDMQSEVGWTGEFFDGVLSVGPAATVINILNQSLQNGSQYILRYTATATGGATGLIEMRLSKSGQVVVESMVTNGTEQEVSFTASADWNVMWITETTGVTGAVLVTNVSIVDAGGDE